MGRSCIFWIVLQLLNPRLLVCFSDFDTTFQVDHRNDEPSPKSAEYSKVPEVSKPISVNVFTKKAQPDEAVIIPKIISVPDFRMRDSFLTSLRSGNAQSDTLESLHGINTMSRSLREGFRALRKINKNDQSKASTDHRQTKVSIPKTQIKASIEDSQTKPSNQDHQTEVSTQDRQAKESTQDHQAKEITLDHKTKENTQNHQTKASAQDNQIDTSRPTNDQTALDRRCPETFTFTGDFCFKIFNTVRSGYASAVARCKKQGPNGRLPIPNTVEKFEVLGKALGEVTDGRKSYWVGMKGTSTGLMRWDDGSEVNRMFWAPGQPNNPSSTCGEMGSSAKYKLNDVCCLSQLFVICEIPL